MDNVFKQHMPAPEYEAMLKAEGLYAAVVSYVQPDPRLPGVVFYLKVPGAAKPFGGVAYYIRGGILPTGAIIALRFEFADSPQVDIAFDMTKDYNVAILHALATHEVAHVHIADEDLDYVTSLDLMIGEVQRNELIYAINESRRYLANVPADLLDYEQARLAFYQDAPPIFAHRP